MIPLISSARNPSTRLDSCDVDLSLSISQTSIDLVEGIVQFPFEKRRCVNRNRLAGVTLSGELLLSSTFHFRGGSLKWVPCNCRGSLLQGDSGRRGEELGHSDKDFLLREAGFPFISDGDPGLSGHLYRGVSCGKVGGEGASWSHLVGDRRRRGGSGQSFSFPFILLWRGHFESFLESFGLSSLDVLGSSCESSNAWGVYKGGDHDSYYRCMNIHPREVGVGCRGVLEVT